MFVVISISITILLLLRRSALARLSFALGVGLLHRRPGRHGAVVLDTYVVYVFNFSLSSFYSSETGYGDTTVGLRGETIKQN